MCGFCAPLLTNTLDAGELNIAQRGRAANFMRGFGTSQTGGVRNRQPVVTVTLDWLAERFPVPDIIKIDVEAGERLVLEGGGSCSIEQGRTSSARSPAQIRPG